MKKFFSGWIAFASRLTREGSLHNMNTYDEKKKGKTNQNVQTESSLSCFDYVFVGKTRATFSRKKNVHDHIEHPENN